MELLERFPEAIGAIRDQAGLNDDDAEWDEYFGALDRDHGPTAYVSLHVAPSITVRVTQVVVAELSAAMLLEQPEPSAPPLLEPVPPLAEALRPSAGVLGLLGEALRPLAGALRLLAAALRPSAGALRLLAEALRPLAGPLRLLAEALRRPWPEPSGLWGMRSGH